MLMYLLGMFSDCDEHVFFICLTNSQSYDSNERILAKDLLMTWNSVYGSMTEFASTNVHMLRYRLLEGDVESMWNIWENTEVKCKSRCRDEYLCVREYIGAFGRDCGACREFYIKWGTCMRNEWSMLNLNIGVWRVTWTVWGDTLPTLKKNKWIRKTCEGGHGNMEVHVRVVWGGDQGYKWGVWRTLRS